MKKKFKLVRKLRVDKGYAIYVYYLWHNGEVYRINRTGTAPTGEGGYFNWKGLYQTMGITPFNSKELPIC